MSATNTSIKSNLTGEFIISEWSPAKASLAEATREAEAYAESAERQGFNVNLAEILEKLGTSDTILNFTTPDGDRAGFGSLLEPSHISFGRGGDLTLIYAHGLIVEEMYSRRGICKTFLREASSRADIVVGHTQNPKILAAFRKVFPAVWPSEQQRRLRPAFKNALAVYLGRIGRPRTFDNVTGKVSNLYGGPLYAQRPQGGGASLAGTESGGDGILIIGFKNVNQYAEAVEPAAGYVKPHLAPARKSQKRAGALHTIIVGGGHAGRDMHIPCAQRAVALSTEHVLSGQVEVIERDATVARVGQLPWFSKLSEANCDPADTVVHVTTGPADRVAVVADAARLGFKSFILEKPLAAYQSDVGKLIEVVKANELKVVVCFPWLATRLTRRLKELIDSNAHGKLTQLVMVQTKSRLGRLNEASGHDTAFEIETPHQVSLALHLAGRQATLWDAHCKSRVLESGATSFMGGASMLLSHGAALSSLRSDLESPTRERRIDLLFEDGWRCVGWYPASGESGWQFLRQYSSAGRLWREETFSDDPLTSLFLESYRYFAGLGPAPVSTLELAVMTTALISKAKCACGIEVESLEEMTLGGGER
jgi:predicted dehydrogenase